MNQNYRKTKDLLHEDANLNNLNELFFTEERQHTQYCNLNYFYKDNENQKERKSARDVALLLGKFGIIRDQVIAILEKFEPKNINIAQKRHSCSILNILLQI